MCWLKLVCDQPEFYQFPTIYFTYPFFGGIGSFKKNWLKQARRKSI